MSCQQKNGSGNADKIGQHITGVGSSARDKPLEHFNKGAANQEKNPNKDKKRNCFFSGNGEKQDNCDKGAENMDDFI
jgi:hypothetical protein